MFSSEISKLAKSDAIMKSQFSGVYAIDDIPVKNTEKPTMYIVNSDVSTSSGKHWLGIYCPGPEKMNEFFDSYGKHPKEYGGSLIKLLESNGKDFLYSSTLLQSQYSGVCGHYCLYYFYYRSRGVPMENIIKDGFTFNTKLNDLFVYDFVRTHF